MAARAGIVKTTALPYDSPMQINFTQHALTRMAERGISQDEVLQTLTTPLLTVPADNGCFEARGMVSRSTGPMLLRVVYANGVVLTVITVIPTTQFKRYGL